MALKIPKFFNHKAKSLHFNFGKLPLIAGIICAIIVVIGLAGIAWFSYTKVYTPYIVTTVPEDKIKQKQEKLNVKDFETVSTKLQEKQKERTAAENPFR